MRIIMLTFIILVLVGCNAPPADDSATSAESNTADTSAPPADTAPADTPPADTGDSSMAELVAGTFNTVLGLGKSLECTVSYVEEGTDYEQVTYFSNNKFRSDVDIIDQTEPFESHVINDGTWLYMWSSMQAQGTKFLLEDMEGDASADDYDAEAVDLEKQYEFKCVPWIADNSKFVPPSNIEFVDIGDMMQDMAANMPTQDELDQGIADACAICANAPTEADRQECMEGLGCDG